MGKIRNRTRPTATFEERLAEQAQKFREMANQLPDGSKARDVLLRRARQMESESRRRYGNPGPDTGRPTPLNRPPVWFGQSR
jgi:hypothetical protein